MRNRFAVFAAALSLIVGPGIVEAHHSASGFDLHARTIQNGILSRIDWTNPHIQLHLDVKDADGKVTAWIFEGHPPAFFQKANIHKLDFVKGLGQVVTVEGNPSKDGSPFGYFIGITFADGSKVRFDNDR